jgi:hypothetical protein
MLKPRIKVIGPTPEVRPGTSGGFPSTPALAKRTPIGLRVTDDVEQPVMFWLSWKSTDNIRIRGLRILDAVMRRRVFERGPLRVVLSGQLSDIGAVVAAFKAEYPNTIVLRYANAQRIPETAGHPASTLFQHFFEHQTLLLQKRGGGAWIIGDSAVSLPDGVSFGQRARASAFPPSPRIDNRRAGSTCVPVVVA